MKFNITRVAPSSRDQRTSPSLTSNWKRIIFSFLFAFGLVSAGFAQVDVTATTGTTNASYTTLKGAFDAINAGTHTGTITIGISGNTTEIAAAVLNASGGSSAYATIAISPTGGAARTITGALATPLIDLNGADNVTIDGLNTGGNALTISNTSTSAVAGTSTIRFINDATTNTVQNCTLSGSSTLITTGTIFLSTTTGATGNDGNIITNNSIGPAGASLPFNGIYALGTTTTTALNNSGVQITNNKIFDFFAPAAADCGILVAGGNTDWTITGNSLYQTATRTMTTAATDCGIQINNTSGNNFIVSSNFVGGSAVSAGGSAWTIAGSIANRFRGISLNVGSTTASSVQGNTIANFVYTSNSGATTVGGAWVGIYLGAGNANIGNTTGNTIGSGTGTGSIAITMVTNSGGLSYGIYSDATSTVSNISNNVIGSMSQTSAAVGGGITGIAATSGTTLTINGNTIGSTTTANSITTGAYTGATAQAVTGINNSSSATISISNNTIANLNNGYLPAAANTGRVLTGILSSSGVNTISGSTVRNLSTAANVTGSESSGINGIQITTSTANQTVSANTVHSISATHATAAVKITGIYWGNSGTGHIIERNFIHSLSASSTGAAVINGIYNFNGSSTYRNNMIRLGIDAAGSSLASGALTLNGILADPVGTNNYYFNSTFIGGTSVTTGTASTAGFRRITAADVTDFRDNIVVNNRSNSTGTGKHYEIALISGSTTFTSNGNVFNQTGTGAVFGIVTATDSTTFTNWKTNTSQDAGSFFSDPQFLVPTGTSATVNLHIDPSITTAVEGNGILISPPTDDFDGQTRSGLTPVDIGADAGNFTGVDLTPPAIAYTPLTDTTTTGARTITATITDASGVPIAGAGLPVLYWKINAGGYTAATATSLGSNQYQFSFGAGAVVTDVVSYYVVAQDGAATPNVTSNPSAGASGFTANPPAASTPPTTPNSYTIKATISGTFNVGIGQTYTDLTAAIGDLNNKVLNGAVTLLLNDASFSSRPDGSAPHALEAFPLTINANAGSSATNTITIKPAPGVTAAVTATIASGPLLTVKTSFVTIDGSNSGGTDRSLTFTNNGATAPNVIAFGSTGTTPITNDTLKNCVIINGVNTSSAVLVSDGTSIGTAGFFNNITIQNNSVQKAFRGILAVASVTGTNGSGLLITGNALNTAGANSIRLNPIAVQGVNGVTVSNNNLGNISNANAEVPLGILLAAGTDNAVVTGNLISSIVSTSTSASASVSGILVSAGAASTSIAVSSNNISTLTSAGTAPSFYAIGSFSPNVAISNNTISGMTQTGAASGFGIVLVGANNNSINGNSVSAMTISGSTSVASGIQTQGTSANVTIDSNKVFNIKNTNTGGYGANGIQLSSTSATANTTVENNVVYDVAAFGFAGSTAADNGYGIIATSGAGYNLYFNSVHMNTNQTATTGLPAAFNVVSTVTAAGALNVRDNIFVSSQTVGTDRYAIYSTAANTVFSAIDYNDYFTSGPNLGFIGVNRAALSDIVAGFGGNANSKAVDPLFNSATNLQPQTGSPVLDAGVSLSGTVTPYVDFTGATRVDPPSMGAYESGSDTSPPAISYTPFGNTTSTTNRTLSSTITDATGVPTSGTGLPVIYYRKNAAGAFVSTQGSFVSGNTYTFTIDYSLVAGGSVAVNDTIQYYVAAQDTASTPNVTTNPLTGASGFTANPPAAATPPTTPNSYSIVASISGSKTVGAGGDYADITAAVNALNNSVITGPVTFVLTDSSYANRGPNSPAAIDAFPLTINANSGSSSTNTVTFKPASGQTVSMTGSAGTALLNLNGADWVIIDGSNNGTSSRDLTITNTNIGVSSAVIWLQSSGVDGATNNIVKNVNLVGSGNTQTLFGVGSGSSTISLTSTGSGNNNNTFQNCNISKTQYGIYSGGASAVSKNTGNVITANLLIAATPNNIGKGGILVGFEDGIQITQNAISGISNGVSSFDAFGISLGLSADQVGPAAFTGNEVTNAIITGNSIGTVAHTATYSATGIAVASATSGTTIIANNFIAGVTANSTSGDLAAGIFLGGGTGSTTQVYFNSVSMTGDRGAGTSLPSYGLAIGGSNPTVDARNNIFYNTQTTASTGKSYAIGTASITFTNLTSDYNDLFVSGTNTFVGQTGGLGTAGTDRPTLIGANGWQVITGKDTHSLSVNPVFVSTLDLHLSTAVQSPVDRKAIAGTGVTIDFDGQTRNAVPDMGADEVNFAGTLQFSSATYGVNENDGSAVITVTRTGGSDGSVGVLYNRADGTAVSPGDYTAPSGNFIWADGDTTNRTITATIVDDGVYEYSEDFSMVLSAPSGGATLGTPSTTTVTITDNDTAPTLSIDSVSVSEGAGNAVFTVTQSAATERTTTFRYDTADGTAVAPGDYTAAVNGLGTITAGNTTTTISIPINNDVIYEGNETFTVTLSNQMFGTDRVSTPSGTISNVGTATIQDNEGAPTVQFSSATYSVNENGGMVTITVTKTGATELSASVNYGTSDGSATQPADYTQTSGTLTFLPNQTSKTFDVPIFNDGTFEGNEDFSVALSSPSGATLGSPSSATVTIIEDDALPLVQFSAANYNVNEGAGTVTVTVTKTGTTVLPSTVNYATSDGSATQPADYTQTSGMLTFLPNDTSKTFTVPISPDTVYEGNETFNITLSMPVGASLGSPNPATVTIVEDDAAPAFSINDVSHNEGDASTTSYAFTVTKTGSTAVNATVDYATANGTATAPSDYTAIPTTGLTFLPNETTKTVTVMVNGDTTYETDETFTVELSNAGNATISDANGAGTIVNDDAAPVFTIDDVTQNEGNSSTTAFTFTITKTGSTAVSSSVTYETVNGSATAPSDFTAIAPTLLTFAPAETSKQVTVLVNGDSSVEPDEMFTVHLSTPTDATISDADGTGTITNDDVAAAALDFDGVDDYVTVPSDPALHPTNAITIEAWVKPSAGGQNYPFARIADNESVQLLVTGSTNFRFQVFTTTGAGAVDAPFTPGSWYHLAATYDGAMMRIYVNGTLVSSAPRTGAITASTQPLLLGFGYDPQYGKFQMDEFRLWGRALCQDELQAHMSCELIGDEAALAAYYKFNQGTAGGTNTGINTLTDSGPNGFTGTLNNFALSGAGSNWVTPGGVTTGTSCSVFLAPEMDVSGNGNSIADGDITPSTTDDTDFGSATVGGSTVTHTFTIDNTGPRQLLLTGTPKVQISGTNAGDFMVTAQPVSPVAATNGTTTFTVKFDPSGAGIRTATVTIDNDDCDEASYDFTIQGTGGLPGSVQFAQANTNDTETNSGSHTVDIHVTRTGGSSGPADVNYTVTDGTAMTADNDYSISPASGMLHWNDGDSTDKLITITVNGDTRFETNETINLSLSTATGATLGTPSAATLTITNDDSAPSFSINDVDHLEGNAGTTMYTFTVTKTGATALNSSVDYETVNGTAVAPGDFTAITTTPLIFGPSDTSMQVTVFVNGDTTFENNEEFTVHLSNASGATISDADGTGAITADDAEPTFTIDSVSQNEGNAGASNFVFTVTKHGSSELSSSVNYMTVNGTATAPSDYTAIPPTQLTFGPNDTTMQISVSVNGDTTNEANEQFTVQLITPFNGPLGHARPNGSVAPGTGTIVNDDAQPSFSIDDVTMNEGNSGTTSFVFTVTKTGSTASSSSVDYKTVNGSALTPSDYTAIPVTTLTFAPADTSKQVTVFVNGDTAHESTEAFTVHLSNAVSATISDADGTGTITNDDGAPVVTNTNDSGPGTLRQALADVADGDTITFNFGPIAPNAPAVVTVTTLTSGELVVNNSITIMGLGANVLEVTRNPNAANFAIFHVVPGKTVTIEGLTISNGNAAAYGGGIYCSGSAVTVNSCLLRGNTAFYGGGIFNDANATGLPSSVTVVNSTFTDNICGESGGAIFNQGDGTGNAVLTVNNSTFSENSNLNTAGGTGGALFNYGGILTVANSTLSKNSAPTGSGIFNFGTLDIGNTILDSCVSGANIAHFGGAGVATSHGYNLSSDAGGGVLTAPGDQVNTDPMLGPLQNNGGPTLTHAPLINSPAVDQGKRDTILTLSTNFDQRGAVRPVNDPAVANAVGGDASDIGAVELQEFVHPTDAVSRMTHGAAGDFDVGLPFVNFANSPIGIECRSGGATGVYKVILNFAGNVSFTSAEVTSCGTTGSVSTATGSGTSQLTINLTGVTNAQTLTLALFDVDDGTNMSDIGLRVGMLVGDVDGSANVNVTDVSPVKLESGNPVVIGNFRTDVTANGVINSTDVSAVKLKSGTGLPVLP
jgi:concanavalin A-like lectin/glucanase superfamily protein/Calx-beta domain-containing protein